MDSPPLLSHFKLTFVEFNLRFQCFNAGGLPIDLNLTGANIKSTKFKQTSKMPVMLAEAGIQRLKSLDPCQKHAGMTIIWDSLDSTPFTILNTKRDKFINSTGLTCMLREGERLRATCRPNL